MTFSKYTALGLLAGTILSAGFISQAHAEPTLSGEVVMELQNEYTTDSDDTTVDGYNNLFFRTEVAPTLQLNENFYIDGVAVWEDIQDREPNQSNFLDNEGVFIEEVKLNYENGAWGAWAGKFNPAFGIAWDFGRGIWGEDFAEDYEITEKIGVGASYTFQTQDMGAHTLAANTFFADTTFLSGASVTNRNTTDKSDGGVSNTEDFSSFVVSLEGEELGGMENLYYKAAYRNQSEGDADVGTDNETGYALTLGNTFPVSERVEMDVLAEYVDIENFGGAAQDNQYLTGSVITTIDENWNFTVGYTARDIDTAGADSDDHLLQVSGGYDFGQGTTAELGYRSAEEGGSDTDIVGGLIRHSFSF